MFEERIAAMNQRTEEAMAANAVQFDKRTYGFLHHLKILLRLKMLLRFTKTAQWTCPIFRGRAPVGSQHYDA